MTAGSVAAPAHRSPPVGQRHAVAHSGKVGRGERLEAEPSGDDSRPIDAVRPAHDRRLLVDGDDARAGALRRPDGLVSIIRPS